MNRWLTSVDPRRVPLFALASVALVAAALALYIVRPQVKARRAALEHRTALGQAALPASALEAERAGLESAVRALAEIANANDRHSSRQALEAAMIASLQNAARSHAVQLLELGPREGAEIDTFHEVIFEVELVGAYGGVVGFLRDAGAAPEVIVVRELALTPLDGVAEPEIHATLVAAAFGELR